MSNEFKPRFQNPSPLPSIDDFRLSTILQKHVSKENEAVKAALLNVAHRHQEDLKSEIRRSLTIEQKIQYLNIDVAKRAQTLRRNVASRRKKHGKALQGSKIELDESLHTEINSIIAMAQEVGTQVQGLAHRALEFDRLRNGPLSGPDPRKYPRLASFFGSGVESVDVDSTGSEIVDGYIDSQTPTGHYERESLDHQDRLRSSSPITSKSNGFQSAYLDDGSVDFTIPHSLSPKDNDLTATSSVDELSLQSPSSETNGVAKEPSPEEITAEAFEQIMDQSISKYRSLRQRKYEELDLFGPNQTKEYSSAFRSKSNPLRLLYSSSALANSDMLKASPVEDSFLKSPFVTSKSLATVSPTPQTSLYKKLRINAQPLKYTKESTPCQCQEMYGDGEAEENGVVNTSPAKEALSRTLHNLSAPAFNANLDANDEIESVLGIEVETDENLSDSTDEELSRYLSIDEFTSDPSDAISPFRGAAEARRKKVEQHQDLREFSPTPKHQPSHRTLKPKGSILKISTGTKRGVLTASPKQKQSKTTFAVTGELPYRETSEIVVDTPYRASPRASFVNQSSAIGMILGTEGFPAEDCVEDAQEAEAEDDNSIGGSTASSPKENGDYRSIGVLRSLLV